MALSADLSPTAIYPEEPKEFITSTTLNLKPSKRTQSLNRDDLMDNFCFEWHTHVTTPPNTPVAPIVEKPVQQTTNQATTHQIPEHTRDLFLPAFTFSEEDNLPTKVDKFMTCERYHSQFQQAMSKTNTTNL